MRTLEKGKKIFALLIIMAGMTMVSCGGSDDEEEGFFSNNDNNTETNPTYELLKKNISTSVSYSDYGWNISIKSNLSNI